MMLWLDIGACFNCMPLRVTDIKEEAQSKFVTENGTPIKCHGKLISKVILSLEKIFHTFHKCAIEQLVLGFHFIRKILPTCCLCSVRSFALLRY